MKTAFAVRIDAAGTERLRSVTQLADGLEIEVAYLQSRPDGMMLVVYQEGPEAGRGTSLPGIQPLLSELVFEAVPETVPGDDIYAFAAPLVEGLTEQWLGFCSEISGPRRAELQEQRDRVQLAETIFLQRGGNGDVVIPVIKGISPWEEDHRIHATGHPFDRWFIDNIARFHGIDFTAPPPPVNELILRLHSSNAASAPGAQLPAAERAAGGRRG